MNRVSIKRRIAIVIVVVLAVLAMVYPAFATTNFKAYSVYRKKDLWGSEEWHAGLMQSTDCTYSGNPVIHVSSQGSYCADAVSWSGYMGSLGEEHFKGVYAPNTTMSSTKKNDVVDTAQDLTSTNMAYTLLRQLDYDTSIMDSTKVQPDEVEKMRCDGLVEYSYEYNDVRICGPSGSSGWNISIKHATTYGYGDDYTPYQQAVDFMTRIQTGIPSAN